MKKALLLTLALSMVLVSGVFADGTNNAPTVNIIPTVIVSDANAPAQTADNYFVYFSALDMNNYILDEDVPSGPINAGVQAAFSVEDADRNLSLNKLSRAREGHELDQWRDTGVVPAHKDILANGTVVDVRAVSDLWSATGSNVPLYAADPFVDPFAFGPFYGFDATRNVSGMITGPFDETGAKATAALVDLLVADDQANTVTATFLVKLSDGPSTLVEGGKVAPGPNIPGFAPILNLWEYAGLQGNFFNMPFVAPVSFPRTSDLLTLGSQNSDTYNAPIPPATVGTWTRRNSFGYWKRDITTADLGTMDALVRARWVLTMGQSVAYDDGVPSVRSRIRPGGEGRMIGGVLVGQDPSFLPYRGLNSEMRLDPIFTPDNILLANENLRRMRNNGAIELRHYHDSGTIPEELASTYGLQFAMDLIDLRGVTSGTLTIDNLLVDIMPRPAGGDVVTLVSQNAGQLQADANWVGYDTGILGPIDDRYQFRGSFLFTKNAGGLRIQGSTFDENVWGFWNNASLGTGATITDGQLVRLRMTIFDDVVTTTIPRSSLRVRLSSSDYEGSILVNIGGFVDFLTTTTFCVPSATGTAYDVYMQAPLLSALGNGQWQTSLDAINTYTSSNPYLNWPGQPQIRFQADWRISEVLLSQVVAPY